VTCEESFAIEMFIGGLKEELQHTLINLNPATLGQAFHAARIEEDRYNLMMRKTRATPSLPWPRNSPAGQFRPQAPRSLPWHRNSPTPANTARGNRKPVQDRDISERRAKGLCFWCDEKFTPGHKCSKRLYNLEIQIEDSSDSPFAEPVNLMDMDHLPEVELAEEEEPLISIHALTGETAFQTLKVKGKAKNVPILILIDSGSSHNFLDAGLAAKIRSKLHEAKPFNVSMADGNQVKGTKGCKNFS